MSKTYVNRVNGIPFQDTELKNNVIEKDNTTEYIPTEDYNPATKKYVDDLTSQETEEETLNTMLEYGLVADALMLDDGTYLSDSDGTLLQL